MAKKFIVRTSIAFVIWAVLLTAGYYYTGFKPDAQFWIYALFLTLGLGGITGKRLLQRLPKFNNR